MIETPAPGIYPGTPDSVYRSWDALNQSVAKEGKRSMYDLNLAERGEIKKTSNALSDGTAIHLFTLPTVSPADHYVVMPDLAEGLVDDKGKPYAKPTATKAYKERVAAFEELHAGKVPISQEKWDMYEDCASVIWENPQARHILEHADECEVAAIAKHPTTGVSIKGLYDILAQDIGVIADLKTCDSAYMPFFRQSAKKYGYAFQAAWYLYLAELLSLDVDEFQIIAIQKPKNQYEVPRVALFHFDPRDLVEEKKQIIALLSQYEQCREKGVWPDYPSESQLLTIGRY